MDLKITLLISCISSNVLMIYTLQKIIITQYYCTSHVNQVYGFDVVWTALVRYKELHGDLTISQRFSVPPDSPEWPQAVWNMKLGEEHSAEYS